MRIAFALALALVVATASANILTDNEYEFLFTKWVGQHTKSYDTPDEFHYRFATWRSNMDYVLSHSSRKPNATHTLAMNEYGDMTNEEFRAKFTGARAPLRSNNSPVKLPTTNLPSSVNWPQKGVVTPVKNQGQCGSCWTFSTTGSVESAHAIKTGNLISLSEQELVDCSHNGGNNGCNGGLMDNAFQWIIQNGGLCTESAYPYHASDGTCKSSSCTPAVTISSYQDVTANDQDQLQAAVAQQPVSIAVDAGGMDWQFYSGGVMSDSCGTQLDHGVLAAGYGTQNGSMYWLVKNSWGANWGMQGYIMLKRTTGSGPGECGIAMSPSYPIA